MKMVLLYIDPGSGSFLIQAIIAAILGGLFYFKNLWRKFKSFFIRTRTGLRPVHDQGPKAEDHRHYMDAGKELHSKDILFPHSKKDTASQNESGE